MNIIKKILPDKIKSKLVKYRFDRERKKTQSLPPIDKDEFVNILSNVLKVKEGDTVFIHSSLDKLNLEINSLEVLSILTEYIGDKGTLVFPTYPKQISSEFLKSGKIFKVKRTPSYTGILSEFARRHSAAVRSLHPTKSVAAIGQHSDYLTKDHYKSPYPYGEQSPYYKLKELNAKVIGLGVKTKYLSAVHTADDVLKDRFPVNQYLPELFKAKCINYEGEEVIVESYAHDMNKMDFNLPKFFKKHFDKDECEDINYKGMNLFRADADKLINKLIYLAEDNITIYKKKHYKT